MGRLWRPCGDGAVAQLGERCNGIAEVRGSIPLSSTRGVSWGNATIDRIGSNGEIGRRAGFRILWGKPRGSSSLPSSIRFGFKKLVSCPDAEIGRQAGLRDQCQKWRTGSSPVVGIARMAELVDALGSGPSWGNPVEVRVLFRALCRRAPIAQLDRAPDYGSGGLWFESTWAH